MYGSYSPNGRKIAFSSLDNGTTTVTASVNANGTGFTQLVPTPVTVSGGITYTSEDADPIWSRDGSHILFSRTFVSASDGSTPTSYPPGVEGIFQVNPDGTDVIQLTDPTSANLLDLSARYSPDGTGIVFVRQTLVHSSGISNVESAHPAGSVRPRQTIQPGGIGIGSAQLFVCNADGSGSHAIPSPFSMVDSVGW
jgi:Tol biopolymer transport system component